MNIKEIKQIIDLMKRSDLTEFEIEKEGLKLRICRGKDDQTTILTTGTSPPFIPALGEQPLSPPPQPTLPTQEEKEEEDENISYIKSPMVGTFYHASSPDTPPFVEVGTQVKEDTVVCIIEAMKVMNEIQAELHCIIVQVLVENGKSVEYGQPLFKVKKV